MKFAKILIDNTEFTSREAAELLEMPVTQLFGLLSRSENASFKYKGYQIKRISPVHHKKGVTIMCLETKEIYNTMDEASKAIKDVAKSTFSAAIHKNGKIVVNGKTYVAVNYTPRKISSPVKRAPRLSLINGEAVPKKCLTTTKVSTPKIKEVVAVSKPDIVNQSNAATKEKAVEILQGLAIEYIKNNAFDKVNATLEALQILTRKE